VEGAWSQGRNEIRTVHQLPNKILGCQKCAGSRYLLANTLDYLGGKSAQWRVSLSFHLRERLRGTLYSYRLVAPDFSSLVSPSAGNGVKLARRTFAARISKERGGGQYRYRSFSSLGHSQEGRAHGEKGGKENVPNENAYHEAWGSEHSKYFLTGRKVDGRSYREAEEEKRKSRSV